MKTLSHEDRWENVNCISANFPLAHLGSKAIVSKDSQLTRPVFSLIGSL